jgi:indolepyruvate ferredoxin oxidoreductase, beta subunit
MMVRSVSTCDIVLVGVGGQGILTIGEILLHAALESDVAASFAPTKGMAQRGGFVKAELRLGRDGVGPRIGEGAADLVLATERSEGLRGIRFVKPGGVFILYDDVWAPTGVMLGAAKYPERETVVAAIDEVGARSVVLLPSEIPPINGRPAAANIVVLGAACAVPALARAFDALVVERIVANRWPKSAAPNVEAFRVGLEATGCASRMGLGESGEPQPGSDRRG